MSQHPSSVSRACCLIKNVFFKCIYLLKPFTKLLAVVLLHSHRNVIWNLAYSESVILVYKTAWGAMSENFQCN